MGTLILLLMLGTNVLELDLEGQDKLTEPKTSHELAPFSQWWSRETHNANLQQSRKLMLQSLADEIHHFVFSYLNVSL